MSANTTQAHKGLLVLPAPETAALSATLMKKTTAVCISTIAYCRNLFDEKDFSVRSFNGVDVRVVKGTCRNSRGVQCLTNWLKGAFDALDKNFLKTLSFEIKDSESRLLERYTLDYSYQNGETKMSVGGGAVAGSTRREIQNLLQNILVATSTLDNLPPNCSTSVKLQYYDKVTPLDYQPPGFKPFDGNPMNSEASAHKWACGNIVTKFHTLTVKATQLKTHTSTHKI